MRSIERSLERPRSIKKNSLNTTTELRNKFGDQTNGVTLSSKFKEQSKQKKVIRESFGSGKKESRRFNPISDRSKTDIPLSPSPPRRKPNFQVPEYQTDMGLFRVDEGPSGRSQKSNKTG